MTSETNPSDPGPEARGQDAPPPESRPPRRRRALRLTLLGLLLLIPPLAALWFYVTQPVFAVQRRRAPGPADPARLRASVESLCGEFGPRDAAHPANLDRVASHLRAGLERAGGRVTDQPFRAGEASFRNVLASFGPESGDRVVVGAHYDTCGPLPGADDNASAVAGLLELARLLGRETLSRRVELAAYCLEEPPFFRTDRMGSAVHARSLRSSGARVRAMIALEMIGFFSDRPGSQRFPSAALTPFYPSTGDFVAVVGCVGQGGLVRRVKKAMIAAGGVPVASITAPRAVAGVDFSDHGCFWDAGFPAVMVTDTSVLRNPNYHTCLDTPATLDYRSLALFVEQVLAAVLDLAR